MTLSKIAGLFKRFDNYLSDGVYQHGCFLVGQDTTIAHEQQEHSNAPHAAFLYIRKIDNIDSRQRRTIQKAC
jgi:hypothetical protein